ncbi:uncharacterized protein [Nicotiana sylvestris]|uniref:uncharacterized protein n=1 Tax=Nicotiana sylvestris TaxID=4096 RepID=UPI00388C93AE
MKKWLDLENSTESVAQEKEAKMELVKWLEIEENSAGQLLLNANDVEAEILKFYKQLLGTATTQIPAVNTEVMHQGYNLSRQQQMKLIRAVNKDEIKQALQGIDDNKAPGCDGYNAFFYKKAWHIIGKEVIQVVMEFFEESVMRLLGLPEKYVRWVMVCISIVSYSIIVNGKPIKPFEAKKGLRQGDPLSPLLFVIAMEYLCRLMKQLGRATLIKSVLGTIQNFWAQVFILAKKIIQFSEAICRRFLWTGSAEPTKKALIAWDKLCAPKIAGG